MWNPSAIEIMVTDCGDIASSLHYKFPGTVDVGGAGAELCGSSSSSVI